VTGLPLSSTTIVYYYTYGSVLAALSRPRDNKCGEALAVMDEVWAYYQSNDEIRAADTSIPSIVQTAELICEGLGVSSGLVETATPSIVTPEASLTPAP
jgi:F0F1-type ATP synthase beta subunit